MGRPAKTLVQTLPDERVVGCGFKTRGGVIRIQFPHPTEEGKYAELSTGIQVPKTLTRRKRTTRMSLHKSRETHSQGLYSHHQDKPERLAYLGNGLSVEVF